MGTDGISTPSSNWVISPSCCVPLQSSSFLCKCFISTLLHVCAAFASA